MFIYTYMYICTAFFFEATNHKMYLITMISHLPSMFLYLGGLIVSKASEWTGQISHFPPPSADVKHMVFRCEFSFDMQ